ncbi:MULTISPECIES: CcdC protein domain-containing protein [unclassified Streptomyces]|uniref:CcdC protein domain-containing protein n=1 Tax=unclassified Streptomyces TaxID=2593676 RepID=UPI0021B0A73C|nr:CcdC protein domain-containing protein [Streptomyces sp. BHT-5-2]
MGGICVNPWLLTAIIAVVVIAVVIKRLTGEPVNAKDLFIAPAILTGIGILSLVKKTDLTGTDLTWIIAGAVLGAALGALRGATVQLVDKGGVLWQRYTGRTFLTLIGTLVATAGFNVLAVKMGMHENARPLQLSIGLSFLGESLMVGHRGMTSGIPFAPARTR